MKIPTCLKTGARVLAAALLCLLSLHCGGNAEENPSVEPTVTDVASRGVTIGQVDDEGNSRITIELGVFGDSEDDLEGAIIDIYVNGVETYSDLAASEHYQSDEEAVVFILTSLAAGDTLTFVITFADGSTDNYAGSVSSEEDGDAALQADEETLALGLQALEERDLAQASEIYCDAYDSGVTDGRVAFGCFLGTLMALPETSESLTILESFGYAGSGVDTFADIVDPILDPAGSSGRSSGSCAEDLDEIIGCVDAFGWRAVVNESLTTTRRFLAVDLVNQLVASGTSADELQDEILALADDFEYLEELMQSVVDDTTFAFDVPAGLFATDSDTAVTWNDARFFLAGVKGALVSLDVFGAYDYGIDVDKILDADGSVDLEILAADLNGTGETVNGVTVDTTAFLTLENPSLVTGAKTRFTEALELVIAGLETLDDGEASELFGRGDGSRDADLSEAIDTAYELLDSAENDVFTPLPGTIRGRNVNVNLAEFFSNPPSASDVTDADPFVYEDGRVSAVEAYFAEMLDGIAQF